MGTHNIYFHGVKRKYKFSVETSKSIFLPVHISKHQLMDEWQSTDPD